MEKISPDGLKLPSHKITTKRSGSRDQTSDETAAKIAKKTASSFLTAESAPPGTRMWDPTPAHTTPGRDKIVGGETPGHDPAQPCTRPTPPNPIIIYKNNNVDIVCLVYQLINKSGYTLRKSYFISKNICIEKCARIKH